MAGDLLAMAESIGLSENGKAFRELPPPMQDFVGKIGLKDKFRGQAEKPKPVNEVIGAVKVNGPTGETTLIIGYTQDSGISLVNKADDPDQITPEAAQAFQTDRRANAMTIDLTQHHVKMIVPWVINSGKAESASVTTINGQRDAIRIFARPPEQIGNLSFDNSKLAGLPVWEQAAFLQQFASEGDHPVIQEFINWDSEQGTSTPVFLARDPDMSEVMHIFVWTDRENGLDMIEAKRATDPLRVAAQFLESINDHVSRHAVQGLKKILLNSALGSKAKKQTPVARELTKLVAYARLATGKDTSAPEAASNAYRIVTNGLLASPQMAEAENLMKLPVSEEVPQLPSPTETERTAEVLTISQAIQIYLDNLEDACWPNFSTTEKLKGKLREMKQKLPGIVEKWILDDSKLAVHNIQLLLYPSPKNPQEIIFTTDKGVRVSREDYQLIQVLQKNRLKVDQIPFDKEKLYERDLSEYLSPKSYDKALPFSVRAIDALCKQLPDLAIDFQRFQTDEQYRSQVSGSIPVLEKPIVARNLGFIKDVAEEDDLEVFLSSKMPIAVIKPANRFADIKISVRLSSSLALEINVKNHIDSFSLESAKISLSRRATLQEGGLHVVQITPEDQEKIEMKLITEEAERDFVQSDSLLQTPNFPSNQSHVEERIAAIYYIAEIYNDTYTENERRRWGNIAYLRSGIRRLNELGNAVSPEIIHNRINSDRKGRRVSGSAELSVEGEIFGTALNLRQRLMYQGEQVNNLQISNEAFGDINELITRSTSESGLLSYDVRNFITSYATSLGRMMKRALHRQNPDHETEQSILGIIAQLRGTIFNLIVKEAFERAKGY